VNCCPFHRPDADETAYVLDYVPRVVGAVVASVACGAVLLSIDLPLGLMMLIGVPIVVAGLQLTAPMIARRVEDQQAEVGRATALATDLISGHRPLQGIGAQANAAARYRVASRRSLAATLRGPRSYRWTRSIRRTGWRTWSMTRDPPRWWTAWRRFATRAAPWHGLCWDGTSIRRHGPTCCTRRAPPGGPRGWRCRMPGS
jgi:ABC-type multidrug transport system fused ATPase/permease subunit